MKAPKYRLPLKILKRKEASQEIFNPSGIVCEGAFQMQISIYAVNLSNNTSKSVSAGGRLKITRPLKPLNTY